MADQEDNIHLVKVFFDDNNQERKRGPVWDKAAADFNCIVIPTFCQFVAKL